MGEYVSTNDGRPPETALGLMRLTSLRIEQAIVNSIEGDDD